MAPQGKLKPGLLVAGGAHVRATPQVCWGSDEGPLDNCAVLIMIVTHY